MSSIYHCSYESGPKVVLKKCVRAAHTSCTQNPPMALPTHGTMNSQSGTTSLLHMHSLTEPDCFHPGSHKRRQGGDVKVWCNVTIDPTRLVSTPTQCNLLLQGENYKHSFPLVLFLDSSLLHFFTRGAERV